MPAKSKDWFGFKPTGSSVPRKVVRVEFDDGYSLNILDNQLPFTIGRSQDRHLVVASSFVSRKHCTIDEVDGEICIVDESQNGTFIDDSRLLHESAQIRHRIHLLFGGEFMVSITPYDANGELVAVKAHDDASSRAPAAAHGVCLVDLCDSTEKTPAQVGNITQSLRIEMLRKNRDKLLLIKNTGDGFLLVYETPLAAFETAERALRFQKQRGAQFDFDLRVTLDAGLTTETADRDRLGLAINRAARIEKVQAGNIEVKGEQFQQLSARNRCLLTTDMKRSLSLTNRARCEHIGACKLKGFGDEIHDLYQYPFG